jgi:hypothetical protein
MDSLTEPQWEEVARRYDALDPAARDAAGSAAGSAAWYAAAYAAGDAAWYAAGSAVRSATLELIEDIENLVFVSLFDNLDA